MMIGFGILTWIRSSMPIRFKLKKERFVDMYFIVTLKIKKKKKTEKRKKVKN